jgi:hypothetical protein
MQWSHKATGVVRAGEGGDCAREWVGSAEAKSRKQHGEVKASVTRQWQRVREREVKEGQPSPSPERWENRTKRGGKIERGEGSQGGFNAKRKPRQEGRWREGGHTERGERERELMRGERVISWDRVWFGWCGLLCGESHRTLPYMYLTIHLFIPIFNQVIMIIKNEWK